MGEEGMGKRLGSTLDGLKTFWQKQDAAKKRLIVVLSVAGILVIGFLVWLLNATTYTVLYTNLSPQDAGEMMQELNSMNVSARAQGTDTILVPEDQVDWIRMELAATGFPRSSTNLDILKQGSGFGITEEDKAVYRRYQLQEDLQNAIKTFDNVTDARVSLIIPRESAFLIESQKIPATAAVLLTLEPGADLSQGNVIAISELVQKSVPNLQPEGVTIIDSHMRLLNNNNGEDGFNAQDRQSMEQQVSERLKQQVMALLQPVFGPASVLAEVSVTLNFDETYIESVRFEPAPGMTSGMVASIEEIREASYRGVQGDGEAGVGENGAGIPIYPVIQAEDAIYEKNSERINYEINTIKEQLVKAQGDISHLSVSVILDSNRIAGADHTASVRQLVATAVGVDESLITVESLPFHAGEAMDDTFEDYAALQERQLRWQQTRFYLLLGSGFLLFIIIMLILARLVRGKRPDKEAQVGQMFPSLDPQRQAEQALAAAQQQAAEQEEQSVPEKKEQQEKKAIAGYIDDNPDLVVSILRSWMAEEQG